jgi:hypothetical protein
MPLLIKRPRSMIRSPGDPMPIQIDAKLNAFRRSASGFFVTLEVAPDSDWEELARAPLGQAFGVAMIAYDAETGKASPGADTPPLSPDAGKQRGESGRPRRPFHEMSRAQQAGILCADMTFQLWLSNQVKDDVAEPADAAQFVRQLCGVHSRADLSEDRVAGKKWDALVTRFYQDTGRLAEVRG